MHVVLYIFVIWEIIFGDWLKSKILNCQLLMLMLDNPHVHKIAKLKNFMNYTIIWYIQVHVYNLQIMNTGM